MECPSCSADVDLEVVLDVLHHEDGAEVSFDCPGCGQTFSRVLTAADFSPLELE